MKSTDITLGYGDTELNGFIPQAWIDDGHYLPLAMPPTRRPIANPAADLLSLSGE